MPDFERSQENGDQPNSRTYLLSITRNELAIAIIALLGSLGGCGGATAKKQTQLDMAHGDDMTLPSDLGVGADLATADLATSDLALSDLAVVDMAQPTPVLSLVGPATISTVSCPAYRLNVTRAPGAPTAVTASLSAFGSGQAYATLANCKAVASPIPSLQIAANANGASFYYRDDTAESGTMGATASGYAPASLAIQVKVLSVLGQANTTISINLQRGMSSPVGACIAGGKFFVVDALDDRVLGWNSIPTATTPPDFVLGQPSLNAVRAAGSTQAPPTASNMAVPTACASDGTRLFVYDSRHYRVLAWNSVSGASGQAADYVLGQPSLTSTAGAGSASITDGYGMACDGTRLFVADSESNRVLVWKTIPTTNAQSADFALGQPDLTSTASGSSATTMAFPMGVASDGTHVFVADNSNNRVLGWKTMPTTSGVAADFVLGQAVLTGNDYNEGNADSPASSLNGPGGIFLSGTTLAVADTSNSRVLVWNSGALPSSNNVAATLAIGQPSLMGRNTNPTLVGRMIEPQMVVINDGAIFVADSESSRVGVWGSVPTTSGTTPDFVLGQPSASGIAANDPGTTGATLDAPAGVSGDGQRLLVADSAHSRVLMWNSGPSHDDQPADLVLGQPDLTSSEDNRAVLPATSTMSQPDGVCSDGTHVFVANTNDDTVLIWSSIPTTNGQPADIQLGSEFGGLTSASQVSEPTGVYSDGTHLFVADTGNNRVLIWNSIPTTNNQNADLVLGQTSFTDGTANTRGLTGSTKKAPTSVWSHGTRQFVADTGNNRVLVWATLPAANGQAASFAFGQADLASGNVNGASGTASGSTLSGPTFVTGDGAHIYVSDTGNSRVLSWGSRLLASSGQSAAGVFGQSSLASVVPFSGVISSSTVDLPMGLYSDGLHLYIADQGPHRVLVVPAF